MGRDAEREQMRDTMGLQWRHGRHRLGLPGRYHCMLIPAVAEAVSLRRSTRLGRLLRRLFEPRAAARPRAEHRLPAVGPVGA
jgi:hypothetical protein